MAKKRYHNLEEINKELKVLQLQRKIVEEELSGLGLEARATFAPQNIRNALFKKLKEIGMKHLIKKLLKKKKL